MPRISVLESALRIDMKEECKITRFQSEGESGFVGLHVLGATPEWDGHEASGPPLVGGSVDRAARAHANCVGHAHRIPEAFC